MFEKSVVEDVSGRTGQRQASPGTRGILLVSLAVFGIMAGQQMVNPILGPLTRELGLSEWQLGLVMTVGASGVVLVSPFWGRRSSSWGVRPVLLTSLVGAAASLLAFAVIAEAGLAGGLAMPVLFALILLSRGLVFGLAWAAAPVTAQAYVAATTSGQTDRVRGMSMVGAAQGLGIALGPALGGVLTFAGLLVPLYVAPAIIAVVAVLVRAGLPRRQAGAAGPAPVRVSPFDTRVWPFLATGFGMFLSFGIVMTTVAFLVQDRLHLSPQATGQTTGLVMLAAAGTMLLVQAVVVPRLGWPPVRLMRFGATAALLGLATVTVSSSIGLLAIGLGLLGLGMGLALPGFTSGPTLLVDRQEQGAVAGLVGSSNALTFVIGPLVGTTLYEIAPTAPYVLGTTVLVGLVGFVLVHPGVRQTADGGR
jgi:DHA1 family tetracycline resistance protein-like MFS transporter